MPKSIQLLEKHDYPCCNIGGKYHITSSATATLCGEKWRYMPTLETFKWTKRIQRLCFLAPNEITCDDCLEIAKQKEKTGDIFYE